MTEEKKKRGCMFWVLIALGVLVGLGVIGAVFGPTEEERAKMAAERAEQEEAEQAAEAEQQRQAAADRRASAVKVTAEELFQAYQNNEAAAQQRYGDKLIEISGTVDGVDLDVFDEPIVKLRTSNQFMSAQIDLTDETQGAAVEYSKGEQRSFLCEKLGEAIGTPMLSECVPVE